MDGSAGGVEAPSDPEEVTPGLIKLQMAVTYHKAGNPRRVGSLARDQPTSTRTTPCSSGGSVRLRPGYLNCMRGGSVKAELISLRGSTLEGRKTQESYALCFDLTRRARWRTLAWSKTLRSRLVLRARTSLALNFGSPLSIAGLRDACPTA